jgi:hypothetical protein
LALKELKRIKIYSKNRYFIQNYYDENIKNDCIEKILSKNTYFQYPILLKNKKIKDELYDYMKKNNILLGKNWSQTNIVPL